MMSTMMLLKHAQHMDHEEIDRFMVSLYQSFRQDFEIRLGGNLSRLTFEQRMARFREWLEPLVNRSEPELDNLKIQSIFKRELPELRQIWRDVVTGEEPGSTDYDNVEEVNA